MAKNIKGLTVEIGGDTTKLEKALKNVESNSKEISKELKDVNKLLKFDPQNSELLAQKQNYFRPLLMSQRINLKL